jgi:hypothetical protein
MGAGVSAAILLHNDARHFLRSIGMDKRKTVIRSGRRIVSIAGDGRLLTVGETAEFLRCSASALNKWRVSGAGPRYVRLNGLVRYRVSDLAAFLENKSRISTSSTRASTSQIALPP